ncbi:helix-hairpin-helix domain-containing protein [Actinoplanes sp. NPDC049596]|uniref:ComEA family DNA-binding protein n=1 Tax=unclassified Actinoplanes TaxID=2626549 RepID=UPI0034450573
MYAAAPVRRPPVTWWWILVPILTLGLATFVMVLVGAAKLRSRGHLAAGFGYLLLTVIYMITSSVTGPESAASDVLIYIWIVVTWLIGTVHVIYLQVRVRQAPAPVPAAGADPAVALAQWRTQRRQEARHLLATNSAAANELRIGRPDAPNRQYDDGGLIDVNHVSAAWLCHELEVSPALADEIVRVRHERGGFTSADDLVLDTSMTFERATVLRDRLVFVPL